MTVRFGLALISIMATLGLASLMANCTAAPALPATSVPPPTVDSRLQVVTVSNIAADWVRAVGQEHVEVFALLPVNSDPHSFQPRTGDVVKAAEADLIFTMGLGLEGVGLDDLVRNVHTDKTRIMALGDVVDAIEIGMSDMHDDGHDTGEDHGDDEAHEDHGDDEAHEDHEAEEEPEEHGHEEIPDAHDHGPLDPHFWFDPLRVQKAVGFIAGQLADRDPENADFYRRNADEYSRELEALHLWIQEQVAGVAPEHRILVTSHDSFQYLAMRYGFKIVGTIMGISTDQEPRAQDLARLLEAITARKVPAIFTENTVNPRLANRLAEDTGTTVVSALYTGSLGTADSPANTYLGMMRYNITTIVEALQ